MDGLPGYRIGGKLAARTNLGIVGGLQQEGFWGGVGVGVLMAVVAGLLVSEDGLEKVQGVLGV